MIFVFFFEKFFQEYHQGVNQFEYRCLFTDVCMRLRNLCYMSDLFQNIRKPAKLGDTSQK